jgi:hypothetical protein
MGRSAEAAASERRTWPIRRFRLGEEPSDDISDVSTPRERFAMMWPLAKAAWLLAGRDLRDYTRGESPGCVLRDGRQR